MLENWIKKIKDKEVNMNDKEYLNKKEGIIELIKKIKEIRNRISNFQKLSSIKRINNYKYTDQINIGKERVEVSQLYLIT